MDATTRLDREVATGCAVRAGMEAIGAPGVVARASSPLGKEKQ